MIAVPQAIEAVWKIESTRRIAAFALVSYHIRILAHRLSVINSSVNLPYLYRCRQRRRAPREAWLGRELTRAASGEGDSAKRQSPPGEEGST